MSLLHEIQNDLLQEEVALSSVILKLRLLAAKLGSHELEEWVKYESEGYPADVKVPEYREIGLTYKGTFFGYAGSQIRNATIPPQIIRELAGEKFLTYEMRDSIASVENLITGSKNGLLHLNISDLTLVLAEKVYEGYYCNEVMASFGTVRLSEIKQHVKNKILELTIELEKKAPEVSSISIGAKPKEIKQETVQQITQQIFNGSVGTAVASLQNSNIQNNFSQALDELQKQYLEQLGTSQSSTILTADTLEELVTRAKEDIKRGEITGDKKTVLEKIADGAKKGKSIVEFAKVLFELYSGNMT